MARTLQFARSLWGGSRSIAAHAAARFSTIPVHCQAEAPDISREIASLQDEDRKYLVELAKHSTLCVDQARAYLSTVAHVPMPEDSLSSAGSHEYICYERIENARRVRSGVKEYIDHHQVVQGHCKDLQQEPYPVYDPNAPDQEYVAAMRTQTEDEYRAGLDLLYETTAIQNKLDQKDFEQRVEYLEAVVREAQQHGQAAAYKMLSRKGFGSPADNRSDTGDVGGDVIDDSDVETGQKRHALAVQGGLEDVVEPDAASDEEEYLDPDGWAEHARRLQEQIESDS